jgi:hypothetical protein
MYVIRVKDVFVKLGRKTRGIFKEGDQIYAANNNVVA